jgi:hypothetical protein
MWYNWGMHEAVLFIDPTRSTCGSCGRGADPRETHHDTIIEYSIDSGSEGCHAEFKYVATNYTGGMIEDATKRMRPDLPFLTLEERSRNANNE